MAARVGPKMGTDNKPTQHPQVIFLELTEFCMVFLSLTGYLLPMTLESSVFLAGLDAWTTSSLLKSEVP